MSNMPDKLTVSFVIPALNEARLLTGLLASIRGLEQNSNIGVHEIIVVDAQSTDDTTAIAASQGARVVSAARGSVSTSRNIGAASATGNVLAFIDADCELPANWLIAISAQFEWEGVIAAGANMALNPDNNTWVERAWFELAHKQHAPASDVNWLATFNLAVSKEAFDECGGFDESLQTCEDVEFGYRLNQLGRLRRLDTAHVIHHGESKDLSTFYRREAWRARGAMGLLKEHWRDPREVLSFLLPFAVVGLLLLTMLILAVYVAAPEYLSDLGVVSGGFLVLLGPTLLALLVSRRTTSPVAFPACFFLLTVYFLARFVGSVASFGRVER